ncbi:SPOR domain-containing protein [Ramlibacter henchirensis]|uniref:SPOR domain-containing protein n=1 Tax=Ramlibacter henchirensis TaxID=204072 RepID=A0A4Z0C308_9BURK|nr:SPOR domain-containing protein [Ramlibacter henchirensis]TFZ05913.1 SPOR domain-containing protein [Ramlibacter henchirensis]
MAFFKFRKGGDESPAAAPQAESVEALRRRARHRLIGAAVLVLLGVIGFPLLFDTQPRPVPVDIPIDIPDRNRAKPLPAPSAAPKAQAPASAAPQLAAVKPAQTAAAAAPSAGGAVTPAVPAATQASVEAKPEPKADSRPAAAAAPSPTPAKAEPASRSAEAAQGRFVVQVGAFTEVGKAREARQKVEKAGLKTYTHVADTKEGRRIRVRVGPFATRAEADKAAGRIKELDLPAAILTL